MNIGQLTFWQFGMFQQDYVIGSTGMVIVWFATPEQVVFFEPGIEDIYTPAEKFAYIFTPDKKVEVIYVDSKIHEYIINNADSYVFKYESTMDAVFVLPQKFEHTFDNSPVDTTFLTESGVLFVPSTGEQHIWTVENPDYTFSDEVETEIEGAQIDLTFTGED